MQHKRVEPHVLLLLLRVAPMWPIVRAVDLDGSSCSAALESTCSTDVAKSHSPFTTESCGVCAGRHQHELRAAGCSHQNIQSYCADATQHDSLLEDQFCQVYYDGEGDCSSLRQNVIANHTRALPTLELGDPSKPAMFFLHGWPDSGAEWSNQFEYFCAAPHGQFYCVAPTWFDFHPDVPARPADDLYWSTQVAAFHAVILEMHLTDVTLVIHDFGSVLGYQLAWQYPSLFKRIISMDIGMSVLPNGYPPNPTPAISTLLGYQQVNIEAFLTNNDTMMRENVRGDPCGECASITAKTGWPYYNFILNGSKSWQSRLAPTLPLDQWRLSLAPDLPASLPLLFLYGTCNIGTGCRGCPPCSKRSFYFFGQDWLDFLNNAGKPHGAPVGSKAATVSGAGHWIQCRAAAQTNAAMSSWLRSVSELGMARHETRRARTAQ